MTEPGRTFEPVPLPETSDLGIALPSGGEAPVARRIGRFLAGVGLFSIVQIAAQAMALGAGILWIRALPTAEYALYTLAGSVLALAAVLTDLGAGSSLQRFFHRGGGSAAILSRYLGAVRSLRHAFALLVVPILIALWWSQAGPTTPPGPTMGVLVLLILLTVPVQQEAALRNVAMRLLGRWSVVYRAEIAVAGARLLGVLAVLLASAGSAVSALGVNLFAALGGVALVRPGSTPPSRELASERRDTLRFLAPIVPDTVYFALQGQLVIWLAALAGTSTQVAQVGALARLGLLFSIPQGLAVNYLVPKLAARHGEAAFRRTALGYAGFLGALAFGAVAVALLLPKPFLALLGASYSGLETALRLVVLAAAASVLGAYFAQVNRTRGWTGSLWVIIAVAVIGQIAYASRVPLASTEAVLGLGVVASSLLALGHLTATIGGLARAARKGRDRE